MPVPVPAPPQTQLVAGSFLTVADQQTFGDDAFRAIDGVTFRPESCGTGGFVELCPDEPEPKTIDSPLGPQTFPVYGIWEGDTCSTLAGVSVFDETRQRVQAKLTRSRSWFIETAIWDGSIATVDADDLTGTGAVAGLVPAVAALIENLNDTLRGSRGVIHVAQSVVPYLEFYGLVTRVANILQVAGTDHVYVAGSGYSGSGPDGDPPGPGETWMYATGAVAVRMSDIFVVPGQEWEAVDRSVNSIEVRAEMAAAPYFDPCAHLAVNVCLPDPGPVCGGS